MTTDELIKHLLEQHGRDVSGRPWTDEMLWAGHNALHLKAAAGQITLLVHHGHGDLEPSCPPPQLVE